MTPARAAFLEDLEWMVTTGETHAQAIAARLGTSPSNLQRRLERAGRSDLKQRIKGWRGDPWNGGVEWHANGRWST